jgi:outer membrane protein assembly factor BamD (BamD/ComL family)
MRVFLIKSYLLLFILLLFQSCGMWDTFTTYFNLYYNADHIFEQVEKSIYEQERSLFATTELNVPGSANQQLNQVIEKCSKILQFHPDGSYVDDALLMLGKSFYYQKNYQKALRKFQELIATQTESDLILETKLWIGKTQMKLKDYESGLQLLGEAREQAIADERDDIIKDSFVEEIVYRIIQEEYQLAIGLANQLVELSDDESIKAEVFYELGKLYNKVNDPLNAVTAFNKVFDYSPLYEIEVGTKLELGKTLRATDEKERALEIFEDMRSEVKFNDVYDKVDLEAGITLIELNRLDEALTKLEYVDTAYVNTETSGIAKYKLGELYQYNFQNFDSATSYYQKATTSQAPSEYKLASNQKTRIFKKYNNLISLIDDYKSELFYAENPEEFVKDSITYVEDSVAYVEDSLRVLEELSLYTEHLESLASFDTLYNRSDTTKTDTTKTDTTKINDSTLVSDSTALRDSLNQSEIPIQGRALDKSVNIDSLFATVWDPERKFPKRPIMPTLSEDSLKSLVVKNKLELGNLFLTELELPDSAYYCYLNVISDYPNTSLQASALYALGSYYLTVDEKQTADSLFNVIYENYRNERIVNAAATKLNMPLIDFDYDPAKDLYAEAEGELQSRNYSNSITKFYSVFTNYPKSPVAPKALYATGWVLENELSLYDSAAVIYDTMSVLYPQSEYSIEVRPKLTSYKLYKEEEKKAIEDSLKKIDQQPEDSLALAEDSLQVNPETRETFQPNVDADRTEADSEPKTQADTLHQGILNDPRRNPRKR